MEMPYLIDDIVYFFNTYSNSCVEAIVIGYHNDDVYKLKARFLVDENGNHIRPFQGSFCSESGSVFYTAAEAYEHYHKKCMKTKERYCSEITDTQSLLSFALTHNLCCDEYTDFEARDAFIKRAKELLDISLK